MAAARWSPPLAEGDPRGHLHRWRRGRQPTSSSRCRLTPTVITTLRRYLLPPPPACSRRSPQPTPPPPRDFPRRSPQTAPPPEDRDRAGHPAGRMTRIGLIPAQAILAGASPDRTPGSGATWDASCISLLAEPPPLPASCGGIGLRVGSVSGHLWEMNKHGFDRNVRG